MRSAFRRVPLLGVSLLKEMDMHTRKSTLPHSQQQLVELMQRINFGRIAGLTIVGGQPVLEPPPQITREIKLGGENGPRPESHAEDFSLKSQVIEMVGQLERIRDGHIESVEIKHGLPFRMLIRETAS